MGNINSISLNTPGLEFFRDIEQFHKIDKAAYLKIKTLSNGTSINVFKVVDFKALAKSNQSPEMSKAINKLKQNGTLLFAGNTIIGGDAIGHQALQNGNFIFTDYNKSLANKANRQFNINKVNIQNTANSLKAAQGQSIDDEIITNIRIDLKNFVILDKQGINLIIDALVMKYFFQSEKPKETVLKTNENRIVELENKVSEKPPHLEQSNTIQLIFVENTVHFSTKSEQTKTDELHDIEARNKRDEEAKDKASDNKKLDNLKEDNKRDEIQIHT